MALGFWAGVRQYDVERTAAEKERKEFLANQLLKTKEIVLPELIKRMDTRRKKGKAKQQRVDDATGIGFTLQTATALERSGQLEDVLARVTDLRKNEKLNPEYIPMLNEYVNNKLSNDADRLAAVQEGLGGNSYITEDEQLQGLLASVSATDESSFSEAIKKLSPTQGETLTDVDPFNFAPGKGQTISESDKRAIKNRLTNSLADALDIRVIETGTGEDMYRSFDDDSANALISKVTDSILNFETSLDFTLSRDTLVAEAVEVMEALSPALTSATGKPFGTATNPQFGTEWAGQNFAEAYKRNLTSDYTSPLNPVDIWGPYINPTTVPIMPPPQEGGGEEPINPLDPT